MKLKSCIRNEYGITLIELIISMTIFTIILSPIAYIYLHSIRTGKEFDRTIEAQSEVNRAIKLIIEDLRKVPSGKVGAEESIDINDSENILVIRYENVSGNLGEQVIYGVVNKILYRRSNNSGTVISANSVTNVQLTGGEVLARDMSEFAIKANNPTDPTYYDIVIEVNPKDVGSTEIKPIKVSSKFVPRFN